MPRIKINKIKKMELKTNETNDIFQTKILNTELYKTNIKDSGSTFFYAINYAFKTFRLLNENQKELYIKEIRENLANKITIELWIEMSKGSIAYLKIIETIRTIIFNVIKIFEFEDLYEKLKINKNEMNILFTLINNDILEKQIITLWEMECSKLKYNNQIYLKQLKDIWFKLFYEAIQHSIENIENNLNKNIKKLNADKKHKIIIKLSSISNIIFDYIILKAFENFIDGIKDYNKWLPLNIISQIYSFSDINANLLIIDYNTGLLYEGMKHIYKKDDFNIEKPFIIILYINEYHFECLGKKMINNNKITINRLFSRDEPFIITCLSYFDFNYSSFSSII
jgi:hypothetical protein